MTLETGRFAPSGTALVSGLLPAGKTAPRSYVLSSDGIFGAGDVQLAAVPVKASRGHFRAWVSFADDALPGRYRLLGCRAAAPSRRSCVALGTVRVVPARAVVAATPALDTAHAATAVLAGTSRSVSTTGADGTRYTLTVPPSDFELQVTLTPVRSLAPSGAVGTLVAGVMITPLGDAPPGAQLTISPARKPGSAARLAGFGGVDPAGAAFDLPIPFGNSATIPLTEFGGYGIVRPPAGKAADGPHPCGSVSAQLAAAGSRPLVSCSSAAQRIRQLSDALESDIAQARQKELATGQADPALSKAIADAQEAGMEAIEHEATRLFNQPPSDEGAAELQVLLVQEIGAERQEELLGNDTSGRASLARVIDYYLANVKRACSGPQSSSSLLAHARQAIDAAQSAYRIGYHDVEAVGLELSKACLRRVRVNLAVGDNTDTTAGQNFDGQSLKLSAEVLIAGKDDPNSPYGVSLHADDKTLSYDSATLSDNPQYQGIFTTNYTDKSGYLHVGDVGWEAHSHTRCDKNRHFVVDRDVRLWIDTGGEAGLWHDSQTIDVTEEGHDLGNHTETVAASVWGIGLDGGFLPHPMSVTLEVPPGQTKQKTETKHNGTCPNPACGTYSYDATFDANDLPGAAADVASR